MSLTIPPSDKETFTSITEEVYQERLYSADRWSDGYLDGPNGLNAADDAKVQIPDTWGMWMDRYKGTWNGYQFPHEYTTETLRTFRKHMVKVALLAITAIMWADRKLERSA